MSETPQPDSDPLDVDGLDARGPEELSFKARQFVLALARGVHYPAMQASINPETHKVLPYHPAMTVKISPQTAALMLANIPRPTYPFEWASGAKTPPTTPHAAPGNDGPG